MAFPLRPPTPRELQRDQTCEALFDAAVEEFRRVGFDRAERAGVSRASFYFHFPTKEHVLLALQRSLERAVAVRLGGQTSLRSAMHELVAGLTEAQDGLGSADLFRDVRRIYIRGPDRLDGAARLARGLPRAFDLALPRGPAR